MYTLTDLINFVNNFDSQDANTISTLRAWMLQCGKHTGLLEFCQAKILELQRNEEDDDDEDDDLTQDEIEADLAYEEQKQNVPLPHPNQDAIDEQLKQVWQRQAEDNKREAQREAQQEKGALALWREKHRCHEAAKTARRQPQKEDTSVFPPRLCVYGLGCRFLNNPAGPRCRYAHP